MLHGRSSLDLRRLLSVLGPVLVAAPLAAPPAQASEGGDGAAGAVEGTIEFEGEAPEREPLAMSEDPICAAGDTQREEDVVVTDGTLRDVHVRLRGGDLEAASPEPEGAVEIDQEDCMYRPRVAGGVPGQTLRIGNSDETLHNVRGRADGATLFNLGQPARGPDIERELDDSAGVVELGCDVHPWMGAYIVVTEHPYFDVTGSDGRFSIEGAPPGTYQIRAWHPELGQESAQVEVTPGDASEVSISFGE